MCKCLVHISWYTSMREYFVARELSAHLPHALRLRRPLSRLDLGWFASCHLHTTPVVVMWRWQRLLSFQRADKQIFFLLLLSLQDQTTVNLIHYCISEAKSVELKVNPAPILVTWFKHRTITHYFSSELRISCSLQDNYRPSLSALSTQSYIYEAGKVAPLMAPFNPFLS